MSAKTDHERYEEAVSAGVRTGSGRTLADTTAERITSLAAERDAYLAALLAKQRDVDVLLAEVSYWQAEARKWRRAYTGHEEAAV